MGSRFRLRVDINSRINWESFHAGSQEWKVLNWYFLCEFWQKNGFYQNQIDSFTKSRNLYVIYFAKLNVILNLYLSGVLYDIETNNRCKCRTVVFLLKRCQSSWKAKIIVNKLHSIFNYWLKPRSRKTISMLLLVYRIVPHKWLICPLLSWCARNIYINSSAAYNTIQ